MIFANEVIKDGIKIVLILVPFVFIVVKGRVLLARDRRFLVLIAGFIFVILGFIMDFTGDIPTLSNIPVLGGAWPLHEFLEDILGAAGFFLFILGIIAEVSHMEFLNRENMRLIGQLNESNKNLDELNKIKSVFVATVSHEMRVALSTSKLAVENLRDQLSPGLNEIQERTLVILHSSVSRLTRIVDDLLDLAKIEAGKMEIKRELINISDLLDEVIFSQRPKAEVKKIVIVDERKSDIPLIWADRDKIIQVVLNILSNALKFTPKEGKIIVRSLALNVSEGVQIEVIDNGPGIDAQQKKKMFNKFESKNIEDQAGTGLGLVIAKEIVELHRGKIWVESELGKGSTFIIQLPKDLREGRNA